MILFGLLYKKYHRSIMNMIEVCKRLRVYTIVVFLFIRTFAPSF